MFTRFWSENSDKAKRVISRIYRVMLTLGVLAGSTFMISAEWLTLLLFGKQYLESIQLLRILSWFLTATFVNSVFAFGLLAINQDQAYLRSMLRGGITAAVLITAMTALGDPFWTALAVVISEFCIMLFNYFEFKVHLKPDVIQPMMSGIATILLSAILFYTLPLSAYLLLPLIIGTAFLTHYLLGGINNKDFKWIYQLAKR
jgi:O-antigen/teichoic acid export membrane protein